MATTRNALALYRPSILMSATMMMQWEAERFAVRRILFVEHSPKMKRRGKCIEIAVTSYNGISMWIRIDGVALIKIQIWNWWTFDSAQLTPTSGILFSKNLNILIKWNVEFAYAKAINTIATIYWYYFDCSCSMFRYKSIHDSMVLSLFVHHSPGQRN